MTDPATGYRTPARLFHWTVAILVLLMIPAGLVMVQQGIPRGLQNALFIFHKNMGVVVLLIVIARLAYRRFNPPPPLPESMPHLQRRIAGASHAALYALLVLMPVAGYIRVRAGGFPIEWLDAMGVPTARPAIGRARGSCEKRSLFRSSCDHRPCHAPSWRCSVSRHDPARWHLFAHVAAIPLTSRSEASCSCRKEE